MMKFRENEEAVSPVIGVILMVAITVILAAVIAAFVFGMSSNIDTNKQVAATATATTNANAKVISITYMGGQDAQLVTGVYFTVMNSTTKLDDGWLNETSTKAKAGDTNQTVGTTGQKDHVVVTAYFTDGSSQVILDTNV
jgi:flagellin-like protein